MSIRMRIHMRLTALILTLMLLISACSFGEADTQETAGRQLEPLKEGRPMKGDGGGNPGDKVASNAGFELYVHPDTGIPSLLSRKNGTWFGLPKLPASLSGPNKLFVQAAFILNTTSGKGIHTTTPMGEKDTLIGLTEIKDGARVHFSLAALAMELVMEYRLTESGMEVTIPDGGILEKDRSRVVSIEPLPFFGAGHQEQEGALFIPDGSGAIIQYKPKHPPYYEPYRQFVYGGDPAFKKEVYQKVDAIRYENIAYGPREQIALPVFGNYDKDKAMLGIITKGEEDAKIVAIPSGDRGLPFYRVSAEFTYRHQDDVFLNSTAPIPLYQNQPIPGDRSIRYVLRDEPDSDYVDLAHSYRNYLITEKGLQPKATEPSLALRIYGGVIREELFGSSYVAMTTFEQAQRMIRELRNRGVLNANVIYEAWESKGLNGDQPKHLPAAGGLGGKEQLRSLAQAVGEIGGKLYLSVNYVKPYEESKSFDPDRAAIRGLNKEIMEIRQPYLSTLTASRIIYYYLKPALARTKYFAKELDDFEVLGVSGLHFRHMGEVLYSDQGSNKGDTNRKDTAAHWTRMMEDAKRSLGGVSVDYGAAYQLPNIDRIENMPMDASHYVYEDASVPFYQIAVHGLVPYASKPMNLRDEPVNHFLRTIEYGGLPSYYLTWESSDEMSRTLETSLFSSRFQDWADTAVEHYRQAYELHQLVHNQAITDHERLQVGVYRTTYENGVQTIVNYTDQRYSLGLMELAPQSFRIVKRGDRM